MPPDPLGAALPDCVGLQLYYNLATPLTYIYYQLLSNSGRGCSGGQLVAHWPLTNVARVRYSAGDLIPVL